MTTPLNFEFKTGGFEGHFCENRDTWNFSVGQMIIATDDASKIIFDANTEGWDTVNITVFSAEASTSFVSDWSQWSKVSRSENWLYKTHYTLPD